MIRDRILGAMVVTAVLAALPGFGQMHKVAKPQKVVRAVGVYEWTGDLAKPKASRFIPVSVFIDDEFQDGGVYVARPIPFALTPGNIYELEDSGLPKGTVELSAAQHLRATDAEGDSLFDDGWLGYGTYHAPPLTASVARLRPSKTLPVITASGDSGKPHLTDKSDSSSKPNSSASTGSGSGASDDPDRPTMKRRDSGSDSSGSNTGSTTNSGGTASSGSASSTAPANDPDRPTMTRKTDTGDSSDSGTTSDDDPDRPTLKRRSPEEMKKAQKASVSVSGGGLALNDDPDRPRLHHSESDAANKGAAELRGMPADMHQMVAVSDAANRDTHVFARAWEDDTEHAVVLAKMQAFARAQLAAYKAPLVPAVSIASSSSSSSPSTSSATAPQGAPAPDTSAVYAKAEQDPGAPTLKRGVPTQPPPVHQDQAQPAPSAATQATKTATKTTTRSSRTKKVAAAPAQTALLDEDLRGYTLSYGGDPTFVYMAHTDGVGPAVRYVTVVAQANGIGGGLGDLKVALASVTDAGHLDLTPRLRFIDAVDAEASNRASLLFELRGQSSRQFALYRVIAAKSEQTFETGTTE